MAGKLIRLTSPSTRIIGGNPAERCKSDAPCLAENASSSVISIESSKTDMCFADSESSREIG